MQIIQNSGYNKIKTAVKTFVSKTSKTIPTEVSNKLQKLPSEVKTGALVALFLLPTLGVVNKCTSKKEESNTITIDKNNNLIDKKDPTIHIVKAGDNLSKIGDLYNVSVIRLCKENNMKASDLIYPNDTIIIPPSYKVKNVNNLEDVAKATGFSKKFLEGIIDFEKVYHSAYKDPYGYLTIGIGHLVKPEEKIIYENKEITKEEIYTLFAQDLLNRELNLRALLTKEAYEKLPKPINEAVIDYIFNKGEGAVSTNPAMLKALNSQDYETVIEHLGKDYSIVKGADGKLEKKYLSGLNKRRMFDLYTASKIYDGNILPDKVVNTINRVYKNGLIYLQEEYKKGFYTEQQYHNIHNEYKNIANKWFENYITG